MNKVKFNRVDDLCSKGFQRIEGVQDALIGYGEKWKWFSPIFNNYKPIELLWHIEFKRPKKLCHSTPCFPFIVKQAVISPKLRKILHNTPEKLWFLWRYSFNFFFEKWKTFDVIEAKGTPTQTCTICILVFHPLNCIFVFHFHLFHAYIKPSTLYMRCIHLYSKNLILITFSFTCSLL